MGFEAELDQVKGDLKWYNSWNKSACHCFENLRQLHNNFYFFKKDHTLEDGIEIVSHPFNWNWILQHPQVIDDFNTLDKSQLYGKRSCGFHVHVCRKYFTQGHLEKMMELFYFNSLFIKKISKRHSFRFCRPFPKQLIWKNRELYPLTAKRMIDKINWNDCGRSSALNLGQKNTIEIRIFQGSKNPKLIWAYLEFVMACVLFTKKTNIKQVNSHNLVRYIKKHKKTFANALILVTNPQKIKY